MEENGHTALKAKDLKIIAELERNARQTNSQIARKVGLSEQVVSYRIKKLIEEKVIVKTLVQINSATLGLMWFNIFIRLRSIPTKEEEGFIEFLKSDRNVVWIAGCRGRYDLVVTVCAENVSHFDTIMKRIMKKYGRYVLAREISVFEQGSLFLKSTEKGEPTEIAYHKAGTKKIELDRKDTAILKILSDDARMPLVEIADRVELSPEAVNHRIKSLMKNGVITGFRTMCDMEKMGEEYYTLLLGLQNITEPEESKLREFLKLNGAFLFIKTIGSYDVESDFTVKNARQFDQILRKLRDEFEGLIREYETITVYKEYKLNFGDPIGSEGLDKKK